jgi:hypothetical protein
MLIWLPLTTIKGWSKLLEGVNAAALCPAVDVVNCPYIDGIGVHM